MLLLTVPYSPLPSDGFPDIEEYNKELETLGNPTWFSVPWLYSECYLYRYTDLSATFQPHEYLMTPSQAPEHNFPSLRALAQLRCLCPPETLDIQVFSAGSPRACISLQRHHPTTGRSCVEGKSEHRQH